MTDSEKIVNATSVEKYDSGLSPEKHNALAHRFNPFMVTVQGLVQTATGIEVKSIEDVAAIALARKTRLALKNIRVDVDKTRKELKEASLREGKAIDGMANIIKYIIGPAENELQEKEDFAKRIEEKRIAALVEDRRAQLESLDVDCSHFDLAGMDERAFESMRFASEAGYKAKKEVEAQELARIEAERLKEEKVEVERKEAARIERERVEAENAKLKQEAAEAEKRAAVERQQQEAVQKKADADRQKAQTEIDALKEKELARKRQEADDLAAKEKTEREAEITKAAAEKAAEQARLAAPDKVKIAALTDDICALTMPSVSSDAALRAVHQVKGILNSAVKCLRAAIKELPK